MGMVMLLLLGREVPLFLRSPGRARIRRLVAAHAGQQPGWC
jgi:hypothetical protein